jgi:hypothetical protein
MSASRSLILGGINAIKNTECGFTTKFWKDMFVSFRHERTGEDMTLKISTVDFDHDVHEFDLCRLFEYIIRCQEDRLHEGIWITDFDVYKYNNLCARETLFPGKTYDEVEAILEEQRSSFPV